jgi:hypothetical protein
MSAVPELRQTAQELLELTKRRLLAGRSRIAEPEAEEHWKKKDNGRE